MRRSPGPGGAYYFFRAQNRMEKDYPLFRERSDRRGENLASGSSIKYAQGTRNKTAGRTV